jgi:hypothetical protein
MEKDVDIHIKCTKILIYVIPEADSSYNGCLKLEMQIN